MKIALISFNPVWENKDENKKACENFYSSIANLNIDIVIFPEMTLTGFSMKVGKMSESLNNSRSIEFFKQQSKKYGIATIFGLSLDSLNTKARNSAVFIDKTGSILGNYCKVHPFSNAGEDIFFRPGDKI